MKKKAKKKSPVKKHKTTARKFKHVARTAKLKHTSPLMKGVALLHKKIKLKPNKLPSILTLKEFEIRIKNLQEQTDLFARHYAAKDLTKFSETLVNLAYTVFGSAYMAGLPFDKLLALAVKSQLAGKRKYKKPDFEKILKKYNGIFVAHDCGIGVGIVDVLLEQHHVDQEEPAKTVETKEIEEPSAIGTGAPIGETIRIRVPRGFKRSRKKRENLPHPDNNLPSEPETSGAFHDLPEGDEL